MNEALQKVVAAVNDENPEKIWAGIPREKREFLPNEICKLLINNDLSFQQAELTCLGVLAVRGGSDE